MTYVSGECMDLEDHLLSVRLRDFLDGQYPSEKAKRLARDINCEVRTAKNILDKRTPHWPSARHLRAIVQRFGRDVLEAVFEADIDAVNARLAQEERDLAEKLAQIAARRQQVTGDRSSLVSNVVAAPRRAQDRRRA